MKKIPKIIFGIVALFAFVAATPPIRYSIYTTGTVAQVDAHVASVSTNVATNGVLSFNTRTGAVVLASNDVVSALGYAPWTGSGSGITNGQADINFVNLSLTNGGDSAAILVVAQDGPDQVWKWTPNELLAFHGVDRMLNISSAGNIDMLGDLTARHLFGEYAGNGTNLTNLNASALASGAVPLARLSGLTSNQLDAATWLLATNTTPGWKLTEPGYVGGTNTFEPVYTKTQGTNLFIRGNTNSAADGLYTVQTNWTDGEATAYLYTNANADVIWSREVDLDRIYTFTNAAGQTNFTEGVIVPTFQSPVTNTLSGGLCGTAAFGWTTNYTFGGFGVNGATASDGAVLAFGQGLDYTTNGSVWTIYSTNITEACLSSNVWYWATNVGSLTLEGDGAGLTNLNASALASGTVPLARLGTNTPTAGQMLASDETNLYWTAAGTGTGQTEWPYTAITNAPWATNGSALDGALLSAGTVSSNALDTATAAQLALAGTGGTATNGLGDFTSFQTLPNFMTNYAYMGHEVLQERIATRARAFRRFAALGIGVTNSALVSCITTSPPGTLILLSNGVHNIGGANVVLATNCFLLGESMSNTVVYGSARATRLVTASGSTLANLTYTNFASAGPGDYNGGIGNAPPMTNMNDVVIVNLMLFGMEDTFRYNYGLFDVKIYNCLSFGRWDNLTCSGNSHETRMLLCNCYFYTDDTCSGNPFDGIRGLRFGGSGTLTVNHCIVTNWLGGTIFAPTDSTGIVSSDNAMIYVNETSVSIAAAAGVIDEMLDPPVSLKGEYAEYGSVIVGKGVTLNQPIGDFVYYLP